VPSKASESGVCGLPRMERRPCPSIVPGLLRWPFCGHHRRDSNSRHTRVVATTVVRSPARPAREMGDTCRQVSWLAALAMPGFPGMLRIASAFPPLPAVASGATLATYSCGGSRGIEASSCWITGLAPRSLFTAATRHGKHWAATRPSRCRNPSVSIARLSIWSQRARVIFRPVMTAAPRCAPLFALKWGADDLSRR
jgi:hypothetical protein